MSIRICRCRLCMALLIELSTPAAPALSLPPGVSAETVPQPAMGLVAAAARARNAGSSDGGRGAAARREARLTAEGG